MDEATRAMHLRAGCAYGRDATCGPPEKPKVAYHTEERAAAAAAKMSAIYERWLEAYPCYWCHDWHIGRGMTPEEITMFSTEGGDGNDQVQHDHDEAEGRDVAIQG